MLNATLDLINRQKSEIERLKKEVSVARDAYISIQDRYEHTKAEAYKKFAERIRECCNSNDDLSTDLWLSVTTDINCVLKEMVGEKMTNEEAINTIEHGCIYRDKRGGEALEIAVIALKKQIPKKPINVEKHYYNCPCCKQDLGVSDDDIFVYENPKPMYCHKCGQALDWSDTECQIKK